MKTKKPYEKAKSFKYKGIKVPLPMRDGIYQLNKMIEGHRFRQSLGTSDFDEAKIEATKLISNQLNPAAKQSVKQKRMPATATFQEVWDLISNSESLDWSPETKRAYYTNMRGLIHWATGIDYDACFNQTDNSLLVYPAWRNRHGVTPIVPTHQGGYRNSHVWYALDSFASLG